MTATRPGGFTQTEMYTVVERACEAVGLDAQGAVLIRGQTNAVLRLARHPILAKLARRGTPVEEVGQTVQLVGWLQEMGFPTAPLYPVPEQPITVDGHAVTFWSYLPQPDYPVPAEALAKPLSILHSLVAAPMMLRHLDPLAAIRSSLTRSTALPARHLNFLCERADYLEVELADVVYVFPEAPLHGDPQHGNALHTEAGVVLCDWDSAVVGQPEWDLVTVEVHCRRFGHGRAHYRRFAETYGWDVTEWDGYPVLRDVRELRMITTNARKATDDPSTLPEVLRRIEAFQSPWRDQRWNIL